MMNQATLSLDAFTLNGMGGAYPGSCDERSSTERLAQVLNPYARSKEQGLDLNDLLHTDPDQGNVILDRLIGETRAETTTAKGGIIYILEGARAGCCSPMQYGGYYLERDREILAEIHGKIVTVVAVIGGDDVYLDFVSDLPGDIFAWDAAASGFDSAYVRGIRSGVQASSDPASEIELIGSLERIPEMRKLTEANV
jgi:hypothetical protein